MTTEPTVLLCGGGTGGHIYPNVAIAERLQRERPDLSLRLLVSTRPGDRAIVDGLPWPHSTTDVGPLPPLTRPWRFLPFLLGWRTAVSDAARLLREHNVATVVATGGFVSGPPIVAARRAEIPAALVNLDAVPGQANRRLVRYTPSVFTVYDSPRLEGAQRIGLPLRDASRGGDDPEAARAALGLDPKKPVLFVTGATHGATSLIEAMTRWITTPGADVLQPWQVFHQCGTYDVVKLSAAYESAGVDATVVDYCDQMGTAWAATTVAISRAGAGSVAEAWANAVPTVFLPNPYHRDQHQRQNARPMVDTGGAVMVDDRIDPEANLATLGKTLQTLLGDQDRIASMRVELEGSRPSDGAETVARWVLDALAG